MADVGTHDLIDQVRIFVRQDHEQDIKCTNLFWLYSINKHVGQVHERGFQLDK